MLSRRELIAGGAGMQHMARGDAAAAQRSDNDNGPELRSIRDVLNAIREDHATQASTVASLRAQQRLFYRVNQRFPQCIDVGIRVWERLQDWHIAHNRPLNIQRTGDGNWQMDFIMTVVVLKHEMAENDISLGYDR
jgi:hypothetical protein